MIALDPTRLLTLEYMLDEPLESGGGAYIRWRFAGPTATEHWQLGILTDNDVKGFGLDEALARFGNAKWQGFMVMNATDAAQLGPVVLAQLLDKRVEVLRECGKGVSGLIAARTDHKAP